MSVNNALKYVLRLCPLLESLELSEHETNYSTPGSSLQFCFNNGENPFLRYFSTAHLNNKYYTFSDRPERVGKCYKNSNSTGFRPNSDGVVNGYFIDIKPANSRHILDL